jgi:hypothetical protein
VPEGIVDKVCDGDNGPVAHFPGNSKIIFCENLREILPFLDETIFYNNLKIIVDKFAVRCV